MSIAGIPEGLSVVRYGIYDEEDQNSGYYYLDGNWLQQRITNLPVLIVRPLPSYVVHHSKDTGQYSLLKQFDTPQERLVRFTLRDTMQADSLDRVMSELSVRGIEIQEQSA